MAISEDILRGVIQMAVENAWSGQGGPFAAVVVREGEIIGKGLNRVTAKNDPTAHAEIEAIRDACRNIGSFQLTDCDIYTSCEPCPMCLGAIFWARPRAIYYAAAKEDAAAAGFDDSFIYKQIDIEPARRSIPAFQHLAEEGRKSFEAWVQSGNKTPY